MADTGAPHFIPYVEPTDLVRDYPAADEAQAEAVAAALDGIPVLAGIGSNVVHTVKTDTFTASVTTGNISGDVTGLTATFTPSNATSKILVILTINLSVSGDGGGIIVYRDGDPAVFIGDSLGNRTRGSGGIFSGGSSLPASIGTVAFLEDAGSTTPTVFSVRLHNHSGSTITVAVNRSGAGDANVARSMRSASAFTVIEVAA